MKKIALLLVFLCGIKTSNATDAVNMTEVLKASANFLNSLKPEQKAMAVVEYNRVNAVKWTNLPCGLACRVGILFGSLNTQQQSLAKAVAKVALGAGAGSGYQQVIGIMEADAALGKDRQGYSSDNYIIAFLGEPSATEKWQLQIGGHHLAVNLTFENGQVASASPLFMGLEPPENTTLKANHDDMVAMLNSFTPEQLSAARLNEGFGDVYLGPGKDGKFPAQKSGIKASELNKEQKALVVKAMQNWVHIADAQTAKSILSKYEKELGNTYISCYGSTDLKNRGDYVRIDGPGVWIEFICQPGAVYPQGIHYHTVYRDHLKDYGGHFNF